MTRTLSVLMTIFIILLAGTGWKISAHGLGTVLLKEVGDDKVVEFEYESFEIVANEPTLLTFRLLESNEDVPIKSIYIRTRDELSQLYMGLNIAPDEINPNIVRLTTTFPKTGKYELNVEISLAGTNEEVKTSFEVDVQPEKINISEIGLYVVSGLVVGIIITLLGGSIWRKLS